ncbi:MAG: phosphoenolpyruvate carboxykinase (ATP) [bacterium]|nr:phosphoenolpyruvate carboxykinase (ATP) [bacterium]
MAKYGIQRIANPLSDNGVSACKTVHWNYSAPRLIEEEVKSGRGEFANTGAFIVNTGKYTGRSPQDKYVVEDETTKNDVWWGPVNTPIKAEVFDALHKELCTYLADKEIFVFEGFAGADPAERITVRMINELGWHNLFCQKLFIEPTEDDLKNPMPLNWTIIDCPGYKADAEKYGLRSSTFIIVNIARKMIIVGGTGYAGEMKKGIFSILNYILPKRGVLSMHCSCNVGDDDDVAIFFGLSGTGKTTLSADPKRALIGDDEHGWTDRGIFNFEGGCYAKTINLSQEMEPDIWNAIRFGAILENVGYDPHSRAVDYTDASRTENTRAAYPLTNIHNAKLSSVTGHPKNILFLTCDAFGVLPPAARLNPSQAMYHFISGYTAKVAGTERGVTEPQATFSACFGAPFLPLHPTVYAELLAKKMKEHDATVWLINTGWTGGAYGVGKRMRIDHTRAIVNSAIEGRLANVEFKTDPIFGFEVPQSCPGVPGDVMNPKNTWADKDAYDQKAKELASMFVKNFAKFQDKASDEILKAAPKI